MLHGLSKPSTSVTTRIRWVWVSSSMGGFCAAPEGLKSVRTDRVVRVVTSFI
jgi:hypothetical protein